MRRMAVSAARTRQPVMRSLATASTATETGATAAAPPTVSTAGRWTYTGEIMVSKVFPAGFGWQFSSGVAEEIGFGADTAGFALTTGIGDAAGVFLGHTLFKAAQSLVSDKVSLPAEIKTGTWLSTGALFAGTSWQPAVNLFHDTLGMGFMPCAGATVATCGTMFLVGLRVGRAAFPFMPAGDSANLKQDFGLSLSIGGATGLFVATDLSFTAAQSDVLYQITSPVLGIGDADSVLLGCIKAGSSTLAGFGVFNAVQNALPAGANWMDNNNPYSDSK